MKLFFDSVISEPLKEDHYSIFAASEG